MKETPRLPVLNGRPAPLGSAQRRGGSDAGGGDDGGRARGGGGGAHAEPGPIPTYPRLTEFPQAAVKAKVNALLAAQEKDDRRSRRECLAEPNAGHGRGSYEMETRVAYLSSRFLSVDVTSSYDCGGPYPNDGIKAPLTIDLTTGERIDWRKVFKPGFMPAEGQDAAGRSTALGRLYAARYPKDADDDCKAVTSPDQPLVSEFTLWLDRKRGLMVQPDFPHVMAACAEAVALSPAVLARHVRDPAALADLTATVKP